MNTKIVRYIGGVILIGIGAVLFAFTTDSQFANLTPSEGSKYLLSMKSGSTYDQDILIHNKIISRLGIYVTNVHPLAGHEGIITISLLRNGAQVSTMAVNTLAINSLDPSRPLEVSLPHPIASSKDEVLRMRITVSDSISTDIALRHRTTDNDFTGEGVSFSVDGVQQEFPIAYVAYERLYPALMKQIGGIVALFGAVLCVLPLLRRHMLIAEHLLVVALAVLASCSALGSRSSMVWYGVGVFLVAVLSWWALRIAGRSRLAALFGVAIMACSTWLPLLLIAPHIQRAQLSFKDALLDPNQIAVSHAAGAYIGFFALFFACIGFLVMVKSVFSDTRARRVVDYAVFAILLLSSVIAFTHIGAALPNMTALVALCMGWFASLGLEATQQFLGRRDKFVYVMLTLLVGIAILDLMHVASVTFAYGNTL